MAKRGRKGKINEEKYLHAVKRTRSTNDKVIADYMKIDRSNVNRFRNNNPHIFEKAKAIISAFQVTRFEAKNLTPEMFKNIPVVIDWAEMQEKRRVGARKIRSRRKFLYNVCTHLNTHPENLTMDQCSELVLDARKATDNKVKFISGLAYLSIRKPIRSFFQLTRGISGELLTSKGIDAGRSKGTGSHSKQKVTKEQRDRFIEAIPFATIEVCETKKYSHYNIRDVQLEIEGLAYFMYYTATRIGSTDPNKQGALSVTTHNHKHGLSRDEWSINLIDKGKYGGIEWDKILMDDGIKKMRHYVSERFSIQPDKVEVELREIEGFLFPIMNKDYDLERKVMKLALTRAGCITTIPNHIWRHTFAQDFLHATDWNYELCASIGGWKDTGTLKLSYGKMSEDAKRRGLRKAMGLPVEDVTYELRF